MSSTNEKIAEWAFKILSVLIIPVTVYIFNLNSSITLLKYKNEVHTQNIQEIKTKQGKMEDQLTTGWSQIQIQASEIRQIRESLSSQNTMIREIHEILRQR